MMARPKTAKESERGPASPPFEASTSRTIGLSWTNAVASNRPQLPASFRDRIGGANLRRCS